MLPHHSVFIIRTIDAGYGPTPSPIGSVGRYHALTFIIMVTIIFVCFVDLEETANDRKKHADQQYSKFNSKEFVKISSGERN